MSRSWLLSWLLLGSFFFGLSVTPNLVEMEHGADKVFHVLVNCIYILGPALGFKQRRHVLTCALIIFAAGLSAEFFQQFIPGRSSSLQDAMANGAGIVLGLIIGYLLRSGYQAEKK